MNGLETSTIRVELHAHTRASKDSLVRPARLIDHCKKNGIGRIAITDHNEIKGALEAKNMAPNMVIVGEEIETTQGELIGYFMQEWVPPGLPPLAAIERLRAQGAVISVAHPFDTVRSKHWLEEDLLAIVSEIDAIEVFNARCLNNKPNQRAEVFAKEYGLLATVGSDAHSLWEVGMASLRLPDFDDSEGFLKALSNSRQTTRLSPAFVHLFSRFAVFYKRLEKLLWIDKN
ncbi:MAG: PHP domain-containing protein [Brevefilum sp.]